MQQLLVVAFVLASAGYVAAENDRPQHCRAQEGLPIDGVKYPKKHIGLSMCQQYKECTCCNSSHTASMQNTLQNVFDSAGLSAACRSQLSLLSCRVCDPEVGVGHRQPLCERSCDDWFRACRDDFFAFTPLSHRLVPCDERQVVCSPLGTLVDTGRELCMAAGYKVTRSMCFDGHLKHGHGLCNHRSVTEDVVERSPRYIAAALLGTAVLLGVLLPRVRRWHRRRNEFEEESPYGYLAEGGGGRTRGIGSGDPSTDPYHSSSTSHRPGFAPEQ